jgi:hypothetical protein
LVRFGTSKKALREKLLDNCIPRLMRKTVVTSSFNRQEHDRPIDQLIETVCEMKWTYADFETGPKAFAVLESDIAINQTRMLFVYKKVSC